MNAWRESISGAAWFFNGEGHIGASVKTRGDHTRRDLYLAISQTDRWVLDQFRDAVGVGTVTGPYERHIRHPAENDVYYFQVNRFEYVQAIIAMMWAWLSPVKKQQATTALLAMRERRNHQPTCRNGHAINAVNLVWLNGPKGQQWRGCRPCMRKKEHNYRVRRVARALLTA